MLHFQDDTVRDLLTDGEIGLEKEMLRVTGDGHMAQTKDPFPDDRHIVRDFCENQVEVNTDPLADSADTIRELDQYTRRVREKLKTFREAEVLWPFSNPPYLDGPEHVPVAQYYGEAHEKTVYREYLARKYGTYLMTFAGIHVNFSFGEKLLRADFSRSGGTDFRAYKDEVYLRLAEQMLGYGWILNILTAASPVLDGSFFRTEDLGKDVIPGYASVRCSEKGYWNSFTPVLDFDSSKAYVDSIERLVTGGQLWAPSELYFPIRLKAGTKYTIEHLRTGWTHIEIRTFDLNPLVPEGIDRRDVEFAKLLMLWLSCREPVRLSREDKIQAVQNFKNAAHLHPEQEVVTLPGGQQMGMTDAAKRIVEEMRGFYKEIELPVSEILDFEYEKLEHPEKRYAFQVLDRYTDHFVEKGLALAKRL